MRLVRLDWPDRSRDHGRCTPVPVWRRVRRPCVVLLTALIAGLPGCSLGSSLLDTFQFEDPPLPGERVAVLVDQEVLTVDPQVANEPVVLPPPRAETEWPQQGGGSTHVMGHVALADNPSEVWSRDIGRGSGSDAILLAGPVIADGIVYTIDTEGEVQAFDALNGTPLWSAETERPEERDGGWGGGIATADGMVVATTGFADVVALDATTGDEIWRTRVDGLLRSSPTIDQGRAFVVARNNRLFVLDLATGELVWEHSGRDPTAGLLGSSSAATFGDIVFVPYSSGEFYALATNYGDDIWFDSLATTRQVATVSSIADIRGRPVIFGRNVYVSSHAGRLAAFVLSTSEQLWELNIGTLTQPWAVGDYLFVTTMRGEVAAIKADSGLVRWVTRIGEFENERRKKGPIVWSGPVLAGDRLIVAGTNGELLSLSPYTGELLGLIKIRGGARLAPVVALDTLYILTDRGHLIAYR